MSKFPLNDPGTHIIIMCKNKEDHKGSIKGMPKNPLLSWSEHKENNREYYLEMKLPDHKTAFKIARRLELLLIDKIQKKEIEITYRK